MNSQSSMATMTGSTSEFKRMKTRTEIGMDIAILLNILLFTTGPGLAWVITRDSRTVIISSIGGMASSWTLAAAAVRLIGQRAEKGIAVLCFLFTILYIVIVWATEISEYPVLYLMLATDTID
jgi:hypothetical protein